MAKPKVGASYRWMDRPTVYTVLSIDRDNNEVLISWNNGKKSVEYPIAGFEACMTPLEMENV